MKIHNVVFSEIRNVNYKQRDKRITYLSFFKLDFNECGSKTYSCHAFATCVNELGSY